MTKREQTLSDFKRGLEDNISKIAIVLPKMQKELVKSYNHYAQENSFKWLGKIRESIQVQEMFMAEVKAYASTFSTESLAASIHELFSSMQQTMDILLKASLAVYSKQSATLKVQAEALEDEKARSQSPQNTQQKQMSQTLNSFSVRKQVDYSSYEPRSPGKRGTQKMGYIPKKASFEGDEDDEEAFVSQYASKNEDGSYSLNAGRIFQRQTELLGKISDEYSESIKQIDDFLEKRLPKRRMKASDTFNPIGEVAYKLSTMKVQGLEAIDPKVLKATSELSSDENAKRMLEKITDDQDTFIMKIMAVHHIIQRSKMRNQGTEPDKLIFDMDEKLKLVEEADSTIEKLEYELNGKKRDVFDLRAKLRELEENTNNYRRRVEKAEKDVQAFKDEANKAKLENVELEQKIQKKKKKITSLKARIEECLGFERKYDVLLKEKEVLESIREKLQAELMKLSEGNQALKDKIKGFNTTLTQEKQQIEVLKDGIVHERRKSFLLQQEINHLHHGPSYADTLVSNHQKTANTSESCTQTDFVFHANQMNPTNHVESRRSSRSSMHPRDGDHLSAFHPTAKLGNSTNTTNKTNKTNKKAIDLPEKPTEQLTGPNNSVTSSEASLDQIEKDENTENDKGPEPKQTLADDIQELPAKKYSMESERDDSIEKRAHSQQRSYTTVSEQLSMGPRSLRKVSIESELDGREREDKFITKGKIIKGQVHLRSLPRYKGQLLGKNETLVGKNYGLRIDGKSKEETIGEERGELDHTEDLEFSMGTEQQQPLVIKHDIEGNYHLEKYFANKKIHPEQSKNMVRMIQAMVRKAADSPKGLEKLMDILTIHKIIDAKSISSKKFIDKSKDTRSTFYHLSTDKTSNALDEDTAENDSNLKYLSTQDQRVLTEPQTKGEWQGNDKKPSRKNQILSKMLESQMATMSFSNKPTERPLNIMRYGSAGKLQQAADRPTTSSENPPKHLNSTQSSYFRPNTGLFGLRKNSQPSRENNTGGFSNWSIVDAMRANTTGDEFSGFEEGERIHDGVYQMGNLIIDNKHLARNADKEREETVINLFRHINSDANLKKKVLGIMQETMKVSRINEPKGRAGFGEEISMIETFHSFKMYYQNMMEQHFRCGDKCVHLRRFFEKIKFDPKKTNTRVQMTVPVSIIKQPVFKNSNF